jgi:WD40 repeat protein
MAENIENLLEQLISKARDVRNANLQALVETLSKKLKSIPKSNKSEIIELFNKIQRLLKPRLFISYAREDDEPFVKRLHEELAKNNRFEVWLDRSDMPSRGLAFTQEIRTAIDESDRLLLIIGPDAIRSDYVKAEWEYAAGLCKPVIPILRVGLGNNKDNEDFAQIPSQLSQLHCIDFRETRPYEQGLSELLRILGNPAPLGDLINVPPLPDHFLARPDDIAALRRLVLANSTTIMSAEARLKKQEGAGSTIALEGMGGIGKSVVAAAFARECDVRRTFADGIVWLKVGQNASIRPLFQELGQALGDAKEKYQTAEDARKNAKLLLADKNCCIILDDVWEPRLGEEFYAALGGGNNCLLITTRRLQLAVGLFKAQEYRVKLLDPEQAVKLLRDWIGRDDPDLGEVARKLGYLALALKLAGARIRRDGLTGKQYVEKFNRIERIRAFADSSERETNLSVSIALSVEAVFGPEDPKRKESGLLYYTLGVFPEDVRVPEETVLRLWQYLRPDEDEFNLEEVLTRVVDLALVDRYVDDHGKRRQYTLHDLLHSYTQEQLDRRLKQTHIDLLNAHAPALRSGRTERFWADLPDDQPYLWDHLAYHLIEAGNGDGLVRTVKHLPYLVKKTLLRRAAAVESDLARARAQASADEALNLLHYLFTHMAHVLNGCGEEQDVVACTLYSRLQHVPMLEKPCQELVQALPVPRLEAWHPLPDLIPSTVVRNWQGLPIAVNACAFSRDGKWLIAGYADGTVVIWDADSGASKHVFQAHSAQVLVCTIAPSGAWFATGSSDNTVRLWAWDRVWDNEKPTPAQMLAGHAGWVRSCAINADENWLVTASDDGTLRTWDCKTGKCLKVIAAHAYSQATCAISPDGARLISTAADGALKVWDAISGELLHTEPHATDVNCCGFSPDGTMLVSGCDAGTSNVWDSETYALRFALKGIVGRVNGCAFTPDSGRLVAASSSGAFQVWELGGDKADLIWTKTAHSSGVSCVAINPSGTTLVSASFDGQIKTWDIASRTSLSIFSAPPKASSSADSAFGKITLASISYDHADEGQLSSISTCAFNSAGTSVLTGSTDGALTMWSAKTGRREMLFKDEGYDDVRAVAFDPHDRWIVGLSAVGVLKVWRSDTGERLHMLQAHDGVVGSCVVTRSGSLLATASGDKTVKIWDTATWRLRETLKHDGWATDCCFDPTDAWIVTCSDDKSIKIWDTTTWSIIRELETPPDAVLASNVSSDGKWISGALSNGLVWIWDSKTGKRRHTLEPGGVLTDATFGPDAKWLISTSNDGAIKTWDVNDGALLTSLHVDGALYWCECNPKGKQIAIVGERGLYWLQLINQT